MIYIGTGSKVFNRGYQLHYMRQSTHKKLIHRKRKLVEVGRIPMRNPRDAGSNPVPTRFCLFQAMKSAVIVVSTVFDNLIWYDFYMVFPIRYLYYTQELNFHLIIRSIILITDKKNAK